MDKYQVGDVVCHYQARQPLQITKVRINRKTQQTLLILDNNDQVDATNPALVFYPQKGDRVVVSAGAFSRWYWAKVYEMPEEIRLKRRKYNPQKGDFYWERKNGWTEQIEWIERYNPDDFPFDVVFELKEIKSNGVCWLQGGGCQFYIAIACLEVLERVRNGAKQPVKSIA